MELASKLGTVGRSEPYPISIPSFEETYGAILLGTFVTLVLYGLSVHQTYCYVRLYPSDTVVLRSIVVGLFVTDTLHCTLLIRICYLYLVTEFSSANTMDLFVIDWSFKVLPLATVTTFNFAQSFYLRRIYLAQIRYRAFITAAIILLMLLELALVAATAAAMVMEWSFEDSTFRVKFRQLSRMNFVAFGVAIVVDCSLTSALVAILYSRRTAFKRTNSMLKSLALYAIIATVMTTISTIPIDILLVIQPHNFIWIAMTMPATKVYSNSVLALLNCRASIRAGKEDLEAICVPEECQVRYEAHTGDPIACQPAFLDGDARS